MRVRKITFALLAAGLTGLTLGAVGAGQATAANAPIFTTVKLPKSYGSAEPRAVVAPNGTSYVVTNGGGQAPGGFRDGVVTNRRDSFEIGLEAFDERA